MICEDRFRLKREGKTDVPKLCDSIVLSMGSTSTGNLIHYIQPSLLLSCAQ